MKINSKILIITSLLMVFSFAFFPAQAGAAGDTTAFPTGTCDTSGSAPYNCPQTGSGSNCVPDYICGAGGTACVTALTISNSYKSSTTAGTVLDFNTCTVRCPTGQKMCSSVCTTPVAGTWKSDPDANGNTSDSTCSNQNTCSSATQDCTKGSGSYSNSCTTQTSGTCTFPALTVDPSSFWKITGNSSPTSTILGITDTSGAGSLLNLIFQTKGAERARITSDGKFGIGDFTGAAVPPLSKLDVRGSALVKATSSITPTGTADVSTATPTQVTSGSTSTKFLTDFIVGDRIKLDNDVNHIRIITRINSDTSLNVDSPFIISSNLDDVSITRIPAAFVVKESGGGTRFVVGDEGNAFLQNISDTFLSLKNTAGGRDWRIVSAGSAGLGTGNFSIYDKTTDASRLLIDTNGRVGIGNTDPEDSAILDITSTNKGLLVPRVVLTSDTDVITIPTPATSLLVYNNGGVGKLNPAGFYYWDSAKWTAIGGSAGLPAGALGQTLRYDGTKWLANNFLYNNGTNIGIGAGNTPNPSALLDLTANDKGILIPRMDTTKRDDITNPMTGSQKALANGLLIYNTDTDGFEYWNGSIWTTISPVITASNGLTKTGNDIQLGGTLTTDTTIANAGKNLNITGNGNVGIGIAGPIAKLDVKGTPVFSSSPTTMTAASGATSFVAASGSITLNVGDYIIPTSDTSQARVITGGSYPNFNVSPAFSSTIVNPTTFNIYQPTFQLADALGKKLYVQGNTGNIGVGTIKPNPSAALDIVSSSKGVLIPRMTMTNRDALMNSTMDAAAQSAAKSLLIFQTDNTAGYYYWDGTAWVALLANSPSAPSGPWTEDAAKDKVFTTTSSRKVGIGLSSAVDPVAQLDVKGTTISSNSLVPKVYMIVNPGELNHLYASPSITFKKGDYVVYTNPSTSLVEGRVITIGGTADNTNSVTISPDFSNSMNLSDQVAFTIHRPVFQLANSSNSSLFYVQGNTGKIGLGTMNPSVKLSIVDSGVGLNRPASNVLSFHTNDLERARIDSAGNVGIGTTAPGARLGVEQTAVDAGGITGKFTRTNSPQFSATGTGYTNIGSYSNILSQIPGSVLDIAASPTTEIGSLSTVLRNNVLSGDAGALTNLRGAQINYGHNNIDGSAPTTANASGLYINPYIKTGTITNMYDIYLAGGSTGGTATNRYGLYQASTAAKNYFAGQVGIGITTPDVNTKLDVAGRVRIGTADASTDTTDVASANVLVRNSTTGIIEKADINDLVDTAPELWTRNGTYIRPTTITDKVGIGLGTTRTPQAQLEVFSPGSAQTAANKRAMAIESKTGTTWIQFFDGSVAPNNVAGTPNDQKLAGGISSSSLAAAPVLAQIDTSNTLLRTAPTGRTNTTTESTSTTTTTSPGGASLGGPRGTAVGPAPIGPATGGPQVGTGGQVGTQSSTASDTFRVVGWSKATNAIFSTNGLANTMVMKAASTDNALQLGVGGTPTLTILSNGNTGLGTITPGAKLDAVGGTESIYARNTATGGYTFLGYNNTGDYGRLGVYSGGWKNLAINEGGGNVGIGNTNPLTKLQLGSGNGNLRDIFIQPNTGSVAPYGGVIGFGAYIGGSTVSDRIRAVGNTAYDGNGAALITASTSGTPYISFQVIPNTGSSPKNVAVDDQLTINDVGRVHAIKALQIPKAGSGGVADNAHVEGDIWVAQ